MKKKIAWAVVFVVICISLFGNPVVKYNNHRLKKAVTALEAGQPVTLNEVVPFGWDTAYTFSPYTSEQEIEEIIGFKSRSIVANNINEGMVHLIFVKGEKVQAAVLGYADALGYYIDFFPKVEYGENAQFTVTKSREFIHLIKE